MTGLVAGRELVKEGYQVDVYEASDHIGGLASTFCDGEGFTYDNGPRFIFSTLAEKIGIREICEPVKYYEHLYVGGKYYLFPFGFARNPKYCLSVGLAMLMRSFHRKPQNLGTFLTVYYGNTFSKEVLIPLIEKWSGVAAHEMSIDFASRLLPTNLAYVIYSVVKKLRGGITEDYYKKGRYIVYPRGSNAKIFEALANTPKLNVHLNAPLQKLETKNCLVSRAIVGSGTVESDYYLSTIPISKMVRLIDNPGSMASWTQFLYRGIMILFIKINRKRVLEGLWTWFPESKYKFYRISEFKNALSELAPKDKTLIAVEIACQEDDPFWNCNAEMVYTAVSSDLTALYGLKRTEILNFDLRKSPCAYPVLRKSTESAQRNLVHQTPFKNLFVAGRTGMFQYRMLEGCYESAMTCVVAMESIMKGQAISEHSGMKRDGFGRPSLVPE